MQLVFQQLLCILFFLLHLASTCTFGRPVPLPSRLALAASSSQPSCQPLLFVFGASMADTGEYAAAMPFLSVVDFPPYGVDYFSRPAGRWSNGRVFTDFISEALGYGIINPYLKAVNSNFTYGANFASAGSTARDLNDSHMFPLSVQVDQFEALLSEMLDVTSPIQGYSQQQIAEAIFLVETANNDYSYQFEETTDFDALDTVVDVLTSMETELKNLYGLGGRNFVVMTLTPIGCAASYLSGFPSFDEDEYGCKTFFNSIAELHNLHLKDLLTNLTAELPDGKWILFDAYSIFLDAYHNPEKYGIEHPFRACCGAGGEHNYVGSVPCGSSGYVNGTFVEATRCDDPSLYVIWDSIHPVDSFAKYIADGVLSGEYLRPAFNISKTCSSMSANSKI